MNLEIKFRVAEVSDYDNVLEFLRLNFFSEEPINNAYPVKDDSCEEEFIMSLLPEGNIILALDASDDNLAGLASFGTITRNYAKESWEESEQTTNKKWRDILKFMNHIESKSDICVRFNVPKALHIHGVTVDKKYRGRALGEKLFNECFIVAKDRHYQIVSADCSSIYSIYIAEKLNMELVSTTTYDEYHEKIGIKVFNPIPPHTEIKSFIKRICSLKIDQ